MQRVINGCMQTQGKQILVYEVTGLVGMAFERVFTPQTFKSTDIWPLNFFIITNEDFALALKKCYKIVNTCRATQAI